MASPRRQNPTNLNRPNSPSSEAQELYAMKKELLNCVKSKATVNVLKTASIQELRGIKKSVEEIDLNPTLMECTTAVFLVAVHHPVEPSPSTVHQWKNALVFILERMKTRNFVNTGESWMLQNQATFVPLLIREYRGIVDAALAFLAARPLKFFFNDMLCFASHYAKQAICLKMKVADYLGKAEELYRRTPFVENGAKCYRLQGWTVYVTQMESPM